MKWTTETPTKRGWYWVWCRSRVSKNGTARVRDIIFVAKHRDELMVVHDDLGNGVAGIDSAIKELGITNWLGPIPEPKPPIDR